MHATRPSGSPGGAGGPEGLDVQFLVGYAGLKPAPTAIASIASAPREYTIFLSMTFPFFPTGVRSAELVRLVPGTGREHQRGQRRCGVQQVLPP